MSAAPVTSCASCGGDVPVPAAGGYVRCGHCDASLWVESRGTVKHYALRTVVAAAEVPSLVRRWLFDSRVPGGASVAIDVGPRPVFYPFFRVVRGKTADWAPAAATPVGAMDGMQGIAGEIVPFDPSIEDEGTFVPATVPAPVGGDGTEVSMVHVPVQAASFEIAGHGVTVLLETVTGRVVASTAIPGTSGSRGPRDAAIIWGGVAAIAFLGVAVPWAWAALAAWLAVAGIAYALLKRRGRISGHPGPEREGSVED